MGGSRIGAVPSSRRMSTDDREILDLTRGLLGGGITVDRQR